ncbi:MAG: metallophosphoesterase [Gemmatimonadaceae bacterium]
MVIGLISDTHGQVRASVHSALAGVDMILHAGDVGGDDVLDELMLIAPVVAVRGNCDDPNDARLLGAVERRIDGVRVHVSHGHELGVPTPERLAEAYDADVIVYGHTHRQRLEVVDGRLVVNPGAAGPRRFDVVPCVARLTITDGKPAIDFVPLT